MTLFTKNFIISLILVLVFFFNQPLPAATDLEGSGVKTKKTLKQTSPKKKIKRPGAKTKKNKIKRPSPTKKKVASKQKRKKAASKPIRKKASSIPRPLKSDVMKSPFP